MKPDVIMALTSLLLVIACDGALSPVPHPSIRLMDPPEQGFFAKELDFEGIPIKAHAVVSDQAMFEAYDRLSRMLQHLPDIVTNLVAAKVELHIIGREQVTTDLPEWRQDKGKPLAEYNGLTRDQRTRGMGGRLVSCGEENLLRLDKDRYRGRDICLHEFAHAIRNDAMNREVRKKFNDQFRISTAKGLWLKSYAASNPDEYFAELTMWYFGTHGDMSMTGPKPKDGAEGLKEYDPQAFALFDDFYQGRLTTPRLPAERDPGHR
ncbi:MAG: anthrax toxin lethal factor-related metalloendopeptidase [Limisphaerales bacterium]